MSAAVIIILVLTGLLVGLLIGAIGVGGVLLVPALVYLADFPVHTAIPACMAAFMVAGLVGGWAYSRRGSVNWSMAGWLGLGAFPGAYGGALALSLLSAQLVLGGIAVMVVIAGIDALRARAEGRSRTRLSPLALVLTGLVTGTGSALSGTGGPLILVPILTWLGLPVLLSVGLGQVIQIPISLMATIGNLNHGEVDFVLAGIIALVMMLGISFGAKLAHSLPAATLRRAVALMLVVSGCGMLYRVFT